MNVSMKLIEQCLIDISLLKVVISFLFFLNLLIVFLVWQRQSIRKIFLYTGLFTWFCAITASLTLFTDLIPLATDGQSYFKWACHIAASGFDSEVVQQYVSSAWTKFGLYAITMLEAGIITLTGPSYEFFHLGQVFIATLAIFFAVRLATIVYGRHAEKYVVVGFLVYFAWYWHVLQNLREAPLLCAMGVALTYFALWWSKGGVTYASVSLTAGVVSAMFRPENILIIVSVVGLTVVYRQRALLRSLGRALYLLPPLVLLGGDLAFRLTNNAPIRMINVARVNRTEAGHYLATLEASSVWDLLHQVPETVRYFLIPIWPWDVSVGLVFLKAYAHSLTAFAFTATAIIGIFGLRKLTFVNEDFKRMQWILLIGFSLVAALYSLIDIGAGVAARHSSFYFYLLLSSLIPVGLWAVRHLSATIVYRGSIAAQPGGESTEIAHSGDAN